MRLVVHGSIVDHGHIRAVADLVLTAEAQLDDLDRQAATARARLTEAVRATNETAVRFEERRLERIRHERQGVEQYLNGIRQVCLALGIADAVAQLV